MYQLIQKRCFEDARYQKKWLVIVDGTQLYCGQRKLNEHCLLLADSLYALNQ